MTNFQYYIYETEGPLFSSVQLQLSSPAVHETMLAMDVCVVALVASFLVKLGNNTVVWLMLYIALHSCMVNFMHHDYQ